MKRSELIEKARKKVDDVEEPFLVDEESFVDFANEAVLEACRRSRLKLGKMTLNVIANQSEYELPTGMIFIRSAKLTNEYGKLTPISYSDLEECNPRWEEDKGEPVHIITDIETGKFTLYPAPETNSILVIGGTQEPIFGETLDILERYHFSLIFWLCHKYYGQQDPDIHDAKLEMKNLELFENEFGKKSSAENETFDYRNLPFHNNDGTW